MAIHDSGSYPIVDESVIDKHIGTIVGLMVFAITAVSEWLRRHAGRIQAVEALAAANAVEIRHVHGDLREIKTVAAANHAETVRMIERVHDKLDSLAKEKP